MNSNEQKSQKEKRVLSPALSYLHGLNKQLLKRDKIVKIIKASIAE